MRLLAIASLMLALAGCGGGGGDSGDRAQPKPGVEPEAMSGYWSGYLTSNMGRGSRAANIMIADGQIVIEPVVGDVAAGYVSAGADKQVAALSLYKPHYLPVILPIRSPGIREASEESMTLEFEVIGEDIIGSYKVVEEGRTKDMGTVAMTGAQLSQSPPFGVTMPKGSPSEFVCGQDIDRYPLTCFSWIWYEIDAEGALFGHYEDGFFYQPRPAGIPPNIPSTLEFSGAIGESVGGGFYSLSLDTPLGDLEGFMWQHENGATRWFVQDASGALVFLR